MGSSRLPGKVMIDLDGMPVLGHVEARVRQFEGVDEVVIATSYSGQDDQIAAYSEQLGVAVFRGDESDVLSRLTECASEYDANVIVRVTADCPLIDPEISSLVIARFLDGDLDYVSNYKPPTFPDGLDTEVFSFEALDRANRSDVSAVGREHVTPYIWQQPREFRLANVTQDDDRSNLCWTLDGSKDLKMIRALAEHVDVPLIEARQRDLLEIIDNHPEIEQINGDWTRSDMSKSVLENEKLHGRRD